MHTLPNDITTPYVRIIEQPAFKGYRFRYAGENKYGANITGVHSTPAVQSHPGIEIVNYSGAALLLISCVEANPPHRPHPNSVLNKWDKTSKGVCHYTFTAGHPKMFFPGLGIQCSKRKDVLNSLEKRKELKVDPFNTGFDHMAFPERIDLLSIRLCFQVFIEGTEPGIFNVPLEPIVSVPLYDKRGIGEPMIEFLSHHSASVEGGTEMCLLCDKVTSDNIQVRFFHDEINWEAMAEITPPGVYKQVSIVFKTPKYTLQDITEAVTVKIQIRRRSDDAVSKPISFQFLPSLSGQLGSKRKRNCDIEFSKVIQSQVMNNVNLKYLTEINNTKDVPPWQLPARPIKPPQVTERVNDIFGMVDTRGPMSMTANKNLRNKPSSVQMENINTVEPARWEPLPACLYENNECNQIPDDSPPISAVPNEEVQNYIVQSMPDDLAEITTLVNEECTDVPQQLDVISQQIEPCPAAISLKDTEDAIDILTENLSNCLSITEILGDLISETEDLGCKIINDNEMFGNLESKNSQDLSQRLSDFLSISIASDE